MYSLGAWMRVGRSFTCRPVSTEKKRKPIPDSIKSTQPSPVDLNQPNPKNLESFVDLGQPNLKNLASESIGAKN